MDKIKVKFRKTSRILRLTGEEGPPRRVKNVHHGYAHTAYCIVRIRTELVSRRFSLESVFKSFLNLFCNRKEFVDLRKAGGGGIKRGLLDKGDDTTALPTILFRNIAIRRADKLLYIFFKRNN